MKKYYAKQEIVGGHCTTLVFDSRKDRNAYVASHDYADPIPAGGADKANAVTPEQWERRKEA